MSSDHPQVRRGRPVLGLVRRPTVLRLTGLVLALVAWEAASRAGVVDVRFLSSPIRAARSAVDYVGSEEFPGDLRISAHVFAVGFGLAALFAIPVGLLLGWYERLGQLFDYLISFGNAAPRIAIVPILVLWLGIGVETKVALVFLMSMFPMLITTMSAVKTVDRPLVQMARSFNASDWQLFRTVIVPACVPAIVAGARLGVGVALIGVVVSEFVAATQGLGYRMQVAATFFDADLLMAIFAMISITGVVFAVLLKRLEQHFDAWRPGAAR